LYVSCEGCSLERRRISRKIFDAAGQAPCFAQMPSTVLHHNKSIK
jgi:hypothetical protein